MMDGKDRKMDEGKDQFFKILRSSKDARKQKSPVRSQKRDFSGFHEPDFVKNKKSIISQQSRFFDELNALQSKNDDLQRENKKLKEENSILRQQNNLLQQRSYNSEDSEALTLYKRQNDKQKELIERLKKTLKAKDDYIKKMAKVDLFTEKLLKKGTDYHNDDSLDFISNTIPAKSIDSRPLFEIKKDRLIEDLSIGDGISYIRNASHVSKPDPFTFKFIN